MLREISGALLVYFSTAALTVNAQTSGFGVCLTSARNSEWAGVIEYERQACYRWVPTGEVWCDKRKVVMPPATRVSTIANFNGLFWPAAEFESKNFATNLTDLLIRITFDVSVRPPVQMKTFDLPATFFRNAANKATCDDLRGITWYHVRKDGDQLTLRQGRR